ncbi:winged helix-turn-helix domain-containing protein [Phenylobacterium sp.]|uniref:winged helix-turn-helix domain-containing protein n=1 Tax=Phenylobacterium sp. TaxID=1871053 RepID=UPI002E361383|nr:winged helix-turn-helix domain-containing protein [Phenylobacterium sp.]HEX4712578.1 winged helix-turn-helix domain-containing protein [Phenylobacterium sp.]
MQLAHQAAISVGSLKVRPSTREVVWDGGREVLQPRVMQVLVALVLAGGEVVSRDDLIAQCWDGRIVSEDAINFVIGQVRKLAARTDAFRLETIPRVGYRLVTGNGAEPAAPKVEAAPPPRASRRRVLQVAAAAAAVATSGGVGWATWRAMRRQAAPVTIAVLPFDDLAPGEQTRFLAVGLAREVRNSLSRIAGLAVVADASSFALSAQRLTDSAIGRRLGADFLLKGSVEQAAGEVRISTELVNLASGLQVWAQTQESRGGDLFKLQDQVAGAVIQELIARIGPDRIREPPPLRRRDPEVFRIMLGANQLIEQTRALRMVNREDQGSDAADQAQDMVKRALAIDPRDPGALVVQAALVRNGWTRELARQPLSGAQRAAAAAELLRQALTADPNDPSALAALGDYYRRFEWRWDEAETLFRRALAIDPNHLEAHWAYGHQLGTLGRVLEHLEHARAMMRLDPETVWRRLDMPRALYQLGDHGGAMALYESELAANPENLFLLRELYFIHLTESDAAGLAARIRRVREDVWKGRPPPAVGALLARAAAGLEALQGRPAALIAMVDKDVAAYDTGAALAGTSQGRASVDFLFIYAMEYAWGGAVGPAIRMLDRALAGRSVYWPACLPFGYAHFPAAMRADPRYAALWRTDPKRQELVRSRLLAIEHRQMAGFLLDGRRVTPKVPLDPLSRHA